MSRRETRREPWEKVPMTVEFRLYVTFTTEVRILQQTSFLSCGDGPMLPDWLILTSLLIGQDHPL